MGWVKEQRDVKIHAVWAGRAGSKRWPATWCECRSGQGAWPVSNCPTVTGACVKLLTGFSTGMWCVMIRGWRGACHGSGLFRQPLSGPCPDELASDIPGWPGWPASF